MNFRIEALPTSIAELARSSSHDDYGNALAPEVQPSPGNPCRHCLRRARAGERLLLFSYSPLERQTPYKEVGPIFVHADGCSRYELANEFPVDFLGPIVLRAYDTEQRICDVSVVTDATNAERATALLAKQRVAFVHARSYTHGCYLFRLDRTP